LLLFCFVGAEGKRARNPNPKDEIGEGELEKDRQAAVICVADLILVFRRLATMAALLRHGARRVGGSVVQRTRAALTTPATVAERRQINTKVPSPKLIYFNHMISGYGESGTS
jgi:hypothetical protein